MLKAGSPTTAPHDGPMIPRSRWLPTILLLCLWLAGVLLMLKGAADPARFDATARRDHANWPGDLTANLWRSAAELLVLLALLRPWSFRHPVGWLLVALAVFLLWTAFTTLAAMHAGPISGAHVVWLHVVCLALLLALAVAAVGRMRRRAGHAG